MWKGLGIVAAVFLAIGVAVLATQSPSVEDVSTSPDIRLESDGSLTKVEKTSLHQVNRRLKGDRLDAGDLPGHALVHQEHEDDPPTRTLATAKTPNFRGWRSSFYSYGRLIRGADGTVVANKESSDFT